MSSPQPGFRAHFRGAGLLLGATLLAACAALPSQVQEARHLTVTYWDFRADAHITLASETDPLYEDLYSKPLDTAAIKLAPDEELEELVRYASSMNFFEDAGNLPGPTADLDERGFGMIVVQADDQYYSMLLDKASIEADPDLLENFSAFRERIRALYDSIQQLQFIQTHGAGTNYFEQEQERLRRENQERTGKKGGGT